MSTKKSAVPFPIYERGRLYWDLLLPNGHLFGIRFRNYSRAAQLLRDK